MIKEETKKQEISIAPMLDWTDRHDRFFLRQISSHVLLYTEMVSTGAILYGDTDRFLRYSEQEHPIALQLGGSAPKDLGKCAEKVKSYYYDEINLNCGCPSDRVQKGRFGACLMKEPDLVADCVKALQDSAPDTTISVKCRIGIDEEDHYDFLYNFVEKINITGCKKIIIHARKAWLSGLSPKENREIPPLKYERAAQIKNDFSNIFIILNGGLKTLDDIKTAFNICDGAMIGREAYENPYFLADIEKHIFNNNQIKTRQEIALSMIPYIEEQNQRYGTPVKSITRHLTGLYKGQKGAKIWRRYLSEHAHLPNTKADIIEKALSQMKA